MMQVGTLRSVQVGTPHRYRADGGKDAAESQWETSFYRAPSAQPRWLYTTHLEGNAQADTKNHGRPDQAVLLYAAAHYPLWRAELGRPDMGPGGFAENFTVDGLSEGTACIGDVYAIGDARIRVTGPRYPCWKIERRWGIEGLTARVAETGRTGWYCRVLHEGLIEPGIPILLAERPYPRWTVALTNDFGHGRNTDLTTARALSRCPLLYEWWQRLVERRALGEE
jgi:MOSC domain-containing protein YiiM